MMTSLGIGNMCAGVCAKEGAMRIIYKRGSVNKMGKRIGKLA
jgi:hypothetical protein